MKKYSQQYNRKNRRNSNQKKESPQIPVEQIPVEEFPEVQPQIEKPEMIKDIEDAVRLSVKYSPYVVSGISVLKGFFSKRK